MMPGGITGRVHSIQSLGAIDGPGIRFVVFLQGCPLRCGCCHNPDTWDPAEGQEYTPHQLADRALRYRGYFGRDGGITVSGGEPLLQADFVRELFTLCRQAGISTCLDTSGCLWNPQVEALLAVTDRVLLDVKYTDGDAYRQYVGCELDRVLSFLTRLNERHVPVTLRQVIIPTLNDSEGQVARLKAIADAHPCVDGVELLPFRKICEVKYEQMGIPFPFAHIPEPSKERMAALDGLLKADAGQNT